MNYYYKSIDNKSWLVDSTPVLNEEWIETTEAEWLEHQPTIHTNNTLTANQQKHQRIVELKSLLSSTDYQAIKYAEGLINAADYEPIKQQRQAWRDEINQLEQK